MRISGIITSIVLILFSATLVFGMQVTRNNGKTYITDKAGEKWEITEAEAMGFKPENFQYGIGKNTIVPLDDETITKSNAPFYGSERVIGFSEGDESKAVSVRKLTRHEIFNTTIDGRPVAAGY